VNRRTSTNERPNPLDTAEWWVVRILLHGGRVMKQGKLPFLEQQEVLRKVDGGELVIMPSDDSIAEPVEVFRSQAEATEHMLKLASDEPGAQFRVVLNADVSV
jgi:hypothetical protein